MGSSELGESPFVKAGCDLRRRQQHFLILYEINIITIITITAANATLMISYKWLLKNSAGPIGVSLSLHS